MDKDFIQKLKSGDKDAFEVLFREYKNMIYTTAYRMTQDKDETEDITSEVLLKIYKNIGGFDEKAKLSTWIYRITYNYCLDCIARDKKVPVDTYETLEDMPDPQDIELSSDEAISKGEKKALYALVDSMPKEYRMALNFYYFENISYNDISEIMGVPIGTVKTYLFRAKEYLKRKMDKMGAL